jgi:filamentous hemagglutinin family protein
MKYHMQNSPTSMRHLPGLELAAISLTVLSVIWVSSGLAQVPTPITPSGLNTQVNLSSNAPAGKVQFDITGGTRPGGGTNLFHSFGDFNVPNNNIANFLNEAGLATSNILGRVTGGNISNIFGTIQTTGFGNANLFLMNPTGFLFGPNAAVNVGGMVAFTSADYLRLADGKLFNAAANPTADAILSTAPVAAYGFLGRNPGAITVQGSQFSVTTGGSISLVGGDITIQSGTPESGIPKQSKLSVPGGQINLASVASPGEIVTGTLDQAPNINGQSFGNLGAIQIAEQSMIDVSGNGGGTILIRGGSFILDNSTISANVTGPGTITNGVEAIGSGIDIQVSQNALIQNSGILETNVFGDVTPGKNYNGVQVKADHIEITGTGFPFPFTGIRSNVGIITQSPFGPPITQPAANGGNSGNITLEANSILIRGFAAVETQVNGLPPSPPAPGSPPLPPPTSKAGDINLTANENLELNGSTISSLLLFHSGTAGNITLTSKHGNIVETGSALAPGIIPMPGDPLPIVNVIFNQSLFSTGKAGNVTFNAPEGDITLAGAIIPLSIQPLPGAPVQEGGSGKLFITANNLNVINNSSIQMDNFSPLPAGEFSLRLNGNLTMDASRIITTARGPAQAADMNITARDIIVTNGGLLSTETRNIGPAGNMNILADQIQITNGGQISSGSAPGFDPFTGQPLLPPGAGGTISIHGAAGSSASLLIDGAKSGIFTNTVGTGAAGNTNITAQTVTIQNGGTISAATSGTASSATGGIITVNAEHVSVNSQGLITAETNGIAEAGTVDINTGTLAINSGGQIRSSSGAETEQVSVLAFSTTAEPSSLAGGTITVQGRTGIGSQADSVMIDGAGSGVFTESTGTRPGGDINILTSQSVAMTNGAHISASSTGAGNAGNIQINAGNQLAMNSSSVTTEANKASGGAIKITTTPSGTVELTDSTITASVLDGTGGGGSVDIDPQFVILQNSQILANSVFGPGGNISITTNLLLPDSTSIISASSQFGQQGTIVIQSPVSPASGKLVPLGQKPLIAAALVSQRCAALAGGNASSFTVAGRDSLPAEPGGWVSSPLALSMDESNEGTATETALSRLSEMEEGTPLLSLRKVAPAGFLTQSFGAGSSDCQS